MSLLVVGLVAGLAGTAMAGEWPSPVSWEPDRRALDSGLYISPRPAAQRAEVTFTVREPAGVARKRWPVRGAIPLFRGELTDAGRIRLLDPDGREIPVQGLATAFWPEKTIRFLCLDFLTDLGPHQEKTFRLQYGTKVKPTATTQLRVIPSDHGGLIVDTGPLKLKFRTGTPFLMISTRGNQRIFGPVRGRAVICGNEKGEEPRELMLGIDSVEVTEQGPVQATVHLLGHYGDFKAMESSNAPGAWRYPVSMFFRCHAGTGRLYLEHTFGFNGDEYRDFVQSYGLAIPTGLADGTFVYGPDDQAAAEAPLGSRLNQFAHDQWSITGTSERTGKRFGGWGAIQSDDSRVLVALREAWQNWPVAIGAEPNGDLTYEILGEKPGRALDLRYCVPYSKKRSKQKIHESHSMEIGDRLSAYYTNTHSNGRAAGLRKIHELVLEFVDAAAEETASATLTPPADVGRAHQLPLVPWTGQQRLGETKALGHIAVYGDRRWEFVKQYYSVMYDILPVIHESNGLFGWVDWGDVPMCTRPSDSRFDLSMQGGLGWSNGERAVAAYLYHYAAGGGRRFLDLGRAFVHHTIGIDTEHRGGDLEHGNYHRHDQVHWRELSPQTCRQGGYRGWHTYHWLTGDPEVRRLAMLAGIDAPAYRHNMELGADRDAFVKVGGNLSSNHLLAHLCWITTGDWRYARAHHAISRLTELHGEQDLDIGWGTPIEFVDGEPTGYRLGNSGPMAGYWFTYGGDDLLLDWASLTGDPAAVNALLHEGRRYEGAEAFYHAPEALLAALAHLDPRKPRLKTMLEQRLGRPSGIKRFRARKSPARYKSAEAWDRYGAHLYGKNGFSIWAAQGLEVLHTIHALDRLSGKPKAVLTLPRLDLPPLLHAASGEQFARLGMDAADSIKDPVEIVAARWYVNDEPVAEASKAVLTLPLGMNRIGLEVTDAGGATARAQRHVMVYPDGLMKFSFGGGPEDFVSGNRLFDYEAGYGWSRQLTGQAITTDEGLVWKEQAQGCGFLLLWRPVEFRITVPQGRYEIDMGGAAKRHRGHAAVLLQGQEVVPVKTHEQRGISWSYRGEIHVGADRTISVGFGREEQGPLSLISYVIVRRK